MEQNRATSAGGKIKVLETLLYVSRSRLDPATAAGEVERIVAKARANNMHRGVTGGLIYTENHFAQVLEGETETLDAMLAALVKDPRHEAVTIVERRPIAQRQFAGWAMAYAGPSFYMDRHIRPLVSGDTGPLGRDEAAARLSALTRQFIELRDARAA